jgi:hypothetical protein
VNTVLGMNVYKLKDDDDDSSLIITNASYKQFAAAIDYVKTIDDYHIDLLIAVLKATGYEAMNLDQNIAQVIYW